MFGDFGEERGDGGFVLGGVGGVGVGEDMALGGLEGGVDSGEEVGCPSESSQPIVND